MPVIKTTGWEIEIKPESRLLPCTGGLKLPVFVRRFAGTNTGYALVYPQGRLDPPVWTTWIRTCQRYAQYDVENKYWVWTWACLERIAAPNGAAPADPYYSLTKTEREALKEKRKQEAAAFDLRLAELSKSENIPEDLWNTYNYPAHYAPTVAHLATPTALQRIIVSRYWDRSYAIIAASVGTGKSRMVVDILSSRATAPRPELNDSARIVLLIAPLALHENWKREFTKWAPKETDWRCHKFEPTDAFWEATERSAAKLFDSPMGLVNGGLVIICTPNALSRPKLAQQFHEHGLIPTAIIVDECQRFFRKPDNKAYKTLTRFRADAHLFYGLSGTPTSKFEDWWALEELMAGRVASEVHWKGATYSDYQRLGAADTMSTSGLWERGWDFARGIKEFHAHRIRQGHIFMADKNYYMKDSLPGLDQQELGDFADMRLSFRDIFERYPDWIAAAEDLQQECSKGEKFKGTDAMFATVLLLRMRQLAAMSHDNEALLKGWVEDSLDETESGVVWVEFVNDPAKQLDKVVDTLNQYGPTCYIRGGMDAGMRQEAIDGFQSGKYRFIVCQVDAAGVGLTLTKAHNTLFLTIPLGYQAVTQAIGRLHRIGQTDDVTSHFAMTSPVAAFARYIYDKRVELNETIPKDFTLKHL